MNTILPVPSHAEWHERTQSVKLSTGITMHYMEAGNPAAPPLLLIHGYCDSSRIWRLPMCALADRFHLYAVDWRGSGQTDHPDAFLYTMKEHADDLAAFLDAMQLPSVYVLAHSMGTLIGQTLAFCAPGRVKKLLLAAAMMRGHDSPVDLAAQFEQYETMDLATLPQAELQAQFLPHPENCRDPEFPDGFFATLRGMSAKTLRAIWFGVQQTDNRRFAQFIQAPLLILWGADDKVLDESYQAEVRESFPQAPYRVFPGISHEIPNEMPNRLAEIAAEFFLHDRVN